MVLRSVRQLLLSPASYFDDRPPAETLRLAAGLVGLLVVVLTAGFLFAGTLMAGTIDATVTMDNPDRPPDFICEQHGDDPDSALGAGCDEPAEIERDAGELVQELLRDYLWIGVVGPLVLWAAGTVVLFGVARLAGGSPSLPGTAAVAGWAALPEVARTLVGVAALRVALADVTITDPERGAAVLESAMAPVDPLLTVASLATFLWQWSLLTGGLSREAELSWNTAAVAVAIPLGLFHLLTAF